MDYQDILYAAAGGIATITINRPEVRNAVRPKTYEELTHAMQQAADDPEIGVVVFTGAGDKAFCSGGDVRDQQTRVPDVGRVHMRRLFALSSAMRMWTSRSSPRCAASASAAATRSTCSAT